jgi:hypothetical protein
MTVVQLPRAVQIRPTPEEPIPSLAGAPGLELLRSATASRLATTCSEAETSQILQAAEVIFASLTPATAMQIGEALERLALHYPVLRRTDQENDLAARDWADDMADCPVDLIAEACRLWRNTGAERFPTPGQLKALIGDILRTRKAYGERAEQFVRLINRGAA